MAERGYFQRRGSLRSVLSCGARDCHSKPECWVLFDYISASGRAETNRRRYCREHAEDVISRCAAQPEGGARRLTHLL